MLTYQQQLTVRLAVGVAGVPEEVRLRHARYLLAAQRADGGFADRQGGSDLYYTGFGLRGLAVLGQLGGPPAVSAASYLRSRLSPFESVIDWLSLIYGAALLEVSAGLDVVADSDGKWTSVAATAINDLRRDDGGYAKGSQGKASSTYHTFLALLCLQLLGVPIPQPDRIVDFIHSQRGDEGGFREIRVSKRASTNPTAAAIGVLRMLDALDHQSREESVRFLAAMQTQEGGLRANTRIPIADLLSTFTGLLTLADLDATAGIDQAAMARYVSGLQRKEGGFHGAVWDEGHDVEYTFYGLAAMGLLGT